MIKEIEPMQISPDQILAGLREVFPECNEMTLELETQLGDIPDWDSMASVNLQSFLLQQFEVEVPLELMADQTTVEELLAFLQNPVPNAAVS
jgi:acyl carrier protein